MTAIPSRIVTVPPPDRLPGARMADRIYEPDEIPTKLAQLGLDHWTYENDWIRRKYNTDGWPQTLMAVNAIGYLCEAAWHHADFAISWGKLTVKLQTHDVGGKITDKDFDLATKIEELVLYRPAADSALAPGNPKKFVFHKE
jgi:4a-hydroxytetrahydrobiopterin dehydratase